MFKHFERKCVKTKLEYNNQHDPLHASAYLNFNKTKITLTRKKKQNKTKQNQIAVETHAYNLLSVYIYETTINSNNKYNWHNNVHKRTTTTNI